MLQHRLLRSKIPVAEKLLQPKIFKSAKQELVQMQQKQKQSYDENSKVLKPLKPGNNILMWKDNSWERGKVEKLHESPRSYVVNVNNRNYRRNRRDLRCAPEPVINNCNNSSCNNDNQVRMCSRPDRVKFKPKKFRN